jgi:hypothetical protein
LNQILGSKGRKLFILARKINLKVDKIERTPEIMTQVSLSQTINYWMHLIFFNAIFISLLTN